MNNKKTIYFHIGMSKAGSKTIQFFCFANNKLLKQHNTIYPTFRNKTSDNAVFINFRPILFKFLNAIPNNFDYENYNDYFKKNIAPTLENSNYEKIIFSEENIYSYKISPEIFNVMLDCGFNLKVILYLRKPAEFLAADWQENIIANFDYRKTLNQAFQEENLFYENIEQFIKKLGKENVIIRPFEKEQWKNGDLCEDFLNCMGIEMLKNPVKNLLHKSLNRDLAEFCLILKNSGITEKEFYEFMFQYAKSFVPKEIINSFDTEGIKKHVLIELISKYQPENDSLKIINTVSDDKILEITNKNIPTLKKLAQFYDKEDFFLDYFPKCYKTGSNEEYKGLKLTTLQQEILSEAKKPDNNNDNEKQSIFNKIKNIFKK